MKTHHFVSVCVCPTALLRCTEQDQGMGTDEKEMRKAGRKGWMMKAWESEWSGVEGRMGRRGVGGSSRESQGLEGRQRRLTEDY